MNGQHTWAGDAGHRRGHSADMSLFPGPPPDQSPPAKPKLTLEERRARQADRPTAIRLRMLIGRELDDRGITTPVAIGETLGEVLGIPATTATGLLTRHYSHEGDVVLLQAAAARLGVQVPPVNEINARLHSE